MAEPLAEGMELVDVSSIKDDAIHQHVASLPNPAASALSFSRFRQIISMPKLDSHRRSGCKPRLAARTRRRRADILPCFQQVDNQTVARR
jgi:hypothetical protein